VECQARQVNIYGVKFNHHALQVTSTAAQQACLYSREPKRVHLDRFEEVPQNDLSLSVPNQHLSFVIGVQAERYNSLWFSGVVRSEGYRRQHKGMRGSGMKEPREGKKEASLDSLLGRDDV